MMKFIAKLLKAQPKASDRKAGGGVRSRGTRFPEKLKDLDGSYRALIRELAKR